jgi:hypothetical protein
MIAHSANRNAPAGDGNPSGLWDDVDGFFYDRESISYKSTFAIQDPRCSTRADLDTASGRIPVRIKSFVGLIPLFAT